MTSATRIVIHGAGGRMGQSVARHAQDLAGATVVAGVERPGSGFSSSAFPVLEDVAGCPAFDVLIDFSQPEPALQALNACRESGRAFVSGTTGMNEAEQAEVKAAAADIPVLMAANFSVGVNLALKLIAQAAAVLGDDYDIEVIGAHHRHKVDSPSGTALAMGQAAAQALGRDLDKDAVYARQGRHGARGDREIGFVTIHAGDIVGDHTLLFAGQGERVEITHKASDRGIFARGALRAATWINGRKPGLYSMSDVLGLQPGQ